MNFDLTEEMKKQLDALRTCGKNDLIADLRDYIGGRAITFRALTPSP